MSGVHNTNGGEMWSVEEDLQFLPLSFFTPEQLATVRAPSSTTGTTCGTASPNHLSAAATSAASSPLAADGEPFVPGAYDPKQMAQLAHFGVRDSASTTAELSRWELNSPFLDNKHFECQEIEPENRDRFKNPRAKIAVSERGKWVLPPPGLVAAAANHMRFVNEDGLVWHSCGFLLTETPGWVPILKNTKYKWGM
ncbi:Fc.00g046620.m01.CDS01 [Cosmosporella sp. VM-42]